jgi:phosphomannomutase/phosphoglucomutase
VRVTVEDHLVWCASSNKPELVVVVESPVGGAHARDVQAVDAVLRTHPEVGATIRRFDGSVAGVTA